MFAELPGVFVHLLCPPAPAAHRGLVADAGLRGGLGDGPRGLRGAPQLRGLRKVGSGRWKVECMKVECMKVECVKVECMKVA